METDAAKQIEELVLEQISQRGEANLALWQNVKAGNVAEGVLNEQLRMWVMQDGAAIRSLDNASASSAIDKISRNVVQCPPYAAVLTDVDRTVAETVRPAVEQLQLSALYLELSALLPSKILERIAEATPDVRALLRQSLTMEEFTPKMAERFSWLPTTRIDEARQAVRSAISQLEGLDPEAPPEMESGVTEIGDGIIPREDPNQPSTGEKLEVPEPSETSRRARDELPGPAPQTVPTENGFVPGATAAQDHPAYPIDDLLERVTYKLMKDGTVLYLLDERPAFVDYGNKIIMKDNADTDDKAILAAMLLAKEKYGGSFEITGTSIFAQQAIALMIKYRVDAHLKNPQQDLMRREMKAGGPPLAPVPGSPTNPVKPFDFLSTTAKLTSASYPAKAIDQVPKSTESGRTAASLKDETSNIDRAGSDGVGAVPERIPDAVRTFGQLMAHGPAPYDWVKDNKPSYFVTLKNADGIARTTWGVELPAALALARANIGDTLALENLGRIPVEVSQPVRNAAGEIIGSEMVQSHRNFWRAHVSERAEPDLSKENEVTRPPSVAVAPPPTAGRSNSSEMLEGTVVAFGAAPYQNKSGNAQSYFISLSNSHGDVRTIWGIDIRRAVQAAGVVIGDQIQLENQGRTAVEVKKPSFDDVGNFIGTIPVKSHKVNWKITLESRSKDAASTPVKGHGKTDPLRGTEVNANAKTHRKSILVDASTSDQHREPGRPEKHTVPPPAPPRNRQRPRTMKA